MDTFTNIIKKIVVLLSSIRISKSSVSVERRKNKARDKYLPVLTVINPGSIVGKKTKGYLSGIFAGDRIIHVGLYIGKFKNYSNAVIHSDPTEGVVIDELYTFLNTDYVEIWTPKFDLTDYYLEFVQIISTLNNKGYDYRFNVNNDSYYCTELIVKIYETVPGITFNKSMGYNHVYKPDNFIDEKCFSLALKL